MRSIFPYFLLLTGSAALAYPPNTGERFPLVAGLRGARSNHRLSLKRVFGQSNAP